MRAQRRSRYEMENCVVNSWMNYVLFRGNKRVTLRPEDMTTEKIAVIFHPDGDFNTFDLLTRSHYEVYGDSTTAERATASVLQISLFFPPAVEASLGVRRASRWNFSHDYCSKCPVCRLDRGIHEGLDSMRRWQHWRSYSRHNSSL